MTGRNRSGHQLSFDLGVWEQILKRCREKNMHVSRYLERLAIDDLTSVEPTETEKQP